MKLNKIKDNKVFKIVSNRYFLIFISFAIWMVFFDENSFFVDRKFNKTKIGNMIATEMEVDRTKI
jgi:hypothetical protein